MTLCLLVGFVFVNQGFDLGGNEATDRRFSPRSQDFRLANRLPVETDRYVLLHCVLRVARIARNFNQLPSDWQGCGGDCHYIEHPFDIPDRPAPNALNEPTKPTQAHQRRRECASVTMDRLPHAIPLRRHRAIA